MNILALSTKFIVNAENSLKIVANEFKKPWPEIMNQVVAAMNVHI